MPLKEDEKTYLTSGKFRELSPGDRQKKVIEMRKRYKDDVMAQEEINFYYLPMWGTLDPKGDYRMKNVTTKKD